MGSTTQLEPHRITKPIQLLAAWLLGLVLVNGSFLASAIHIPQPEWLAIALVLASIINVPLFLVAIFLLQTRCRPEMQEDSFYAKYLESQTGYTEREVAGDAFANLREEVARIESAIAEHGMAVNHAESEELDWSLVTVLVNKNLPNFSKIVQALGTAGIPVHERFGAGADVPKPPISIAIGSGFTVEQMKALCQAIASVEKAWISFAHPDAEDYDNKVLIGAYGTYSHGLKIVDFLALLDSASIKTTDDAYKFLGIGSGPFSPDF